MDIVPSDFYAPLDYVDQTYLRESAAYINTRRALTYDLIVQMGAKLIEVNERFFSHRRYPTFRSWCDVEFPESYSTLVNYMNVAKRFGELGNTPNLTMGALYQLARETVDDETRHMAITLTDHGHHVDHRKAYVLANAPEYVRRLMVDEDLSGKQAHALAITLKQVADPIRQFAIDHQVSDANLVDALDDRAITKIQEDDGVLNGIEWAKHVSESTLSDLERWKEDRNRMIKQEHAARYRYAIVTGKLQRAPDGFVVKSTTPLPDDWFECNNIEILLKVRDETD